MEKEYLRCPNCEDGKGQIYLMEVAGVERRFYVCSNCGRVWKRYWALEISLASELRWHDYLMKMGISPSNMKVTKKKPMVIVEEEAPADQLLPSKNKEYLLCPLCGKYGVIHRMSIRGLKEEIDVCEECDLAWEKGTALQIDCFTLDECIEKAGISSPKIEIIEQRRLVIMEEDQA